jgi:uncharacterized protein YkwD
MQTEKFFSLTTLCAVLMLAAVACGKRDKAPNTVTSTPLIPTIEKVPPTPTIVPAPTPAESAEEGEKDQGWDAALLPNVAVVNAGETFVETWRIRNTGTRAWESASGGFRWVFVGGDQMGGPAQIPIVGTIPAGGEHAVTVELTAPLEVGQYEGRWQVKDSSGRPVGPESWVRIEVVAASVEPPAEEAVIGDFVSEEPPDEVVLEEGCLDAAPVADVTIPDGELLDPGESFTKIWRIRNSGTCEWSDDLGKFQWVFVEGNQMGGPDRVAVAGPVSPGSDYDVSVELTAPQEAGQHRGMWNMVGPNGEPFGVVFWVLIQVPGEDTSAGAGTPPPVGVGDSPPEDVADWPQVVWQHINGERDRHGLPQLAYNEKLALAAQGQANDCSGRGSCSHTGSDGSDVRMRVQRVGYQGTSDESWALNVSPQAAVAWWLDEVPPDDWHRRMLLSDYLTEVGVGVASADGGLYYFIAVFGRTGG